MWDLESGQVTTTLVETNGRAEAFSPNGKRLATSGSSGTILVWELGSPKGPLTLKGESDMVLSLTFRPDGSRLASAHWYRKFMVWDPSNGEKKLSVDGSTRVVACVTYSPNGKALASCGKENGIKLRDAGTGHLTATLDGHDGYRFAVRFSPDGKTLASAGVDGTRHPLGHRRQETTGDDYGPCQCGSMPCFFPGRQVRGVGE